MDGAAASTISEVSPEAIASSIVATGTTWISSVASRVTEALPSAQAIGVVTEVAAASVSKTPAPVTSRAGWGKWLQLTTGVGTSAGLLYALFRRANAHYAHVTITEMLTLPEETTGSFVEVCMPLAGEIRIDCDTLAHCKYQLKMNASIKASQGRVRDDSQRSGRSVVSLTNTNKSELCDSWLSDYTGNLHFSTPCVTSEAMLMTYESTSHESLQPAVSIQDCFVQPASSLSHHRLSFNLHVFNSAMDVAVSMTLPKGSRILKVSTGGKGSVTTPNMYSPNEVTWNVGTFVREVDAESPVRSSRRTVLRAEGLTNAEGKASYDCIPDSTIRESTRSVPSTMQDEADLGRTIGASATFNGISAVELCAQEQMLAMTERSSQMVSFELVYAINVREAERELNQRRTTAQATEAMVKNRRERRQEERAQKKKARQDARSKFRASPAVEENESQDEEDDFIDQGVLDESHISFNPSEHTPGVHLSYSTQATASGLTVRKLMTSAEERNYNLVEDLLGPAESTEMGAPIPRYSRKQRAARAMLNAAADAFYFARRQSRLTYRRLYSLATRTPLQLSEEEINEARAARTVPHTSDVAARFESADNVRVPQSIVKTMRAADAQKALVPASPFGTNPFADGFNGAAPREDDGFVHVERPSVASPQGGPRVAFADPPLPTPQLPLPQPRETFVDQLIRERNSTVPKLVKKVRYVTRFSQLVRVSTQF